MANSVPYIDLVKQNQIIQPEINQAIGVVLSHGQFILGPEVAALEQSLAEYIGCKHVIGVNSGTDALVLSLKAHGIGQGDEVITTSNSFIATATAISLVGAKPVFVDIDPITMLISPEKISKAVTDKAKAIIPVHLNGFPCEMDKIKGICDQHGLTLIEDAAQGIGVKFKGQHAGTFGTGCFSLHPLKLLGGCGDGGFITTDSDAIAEKLRLMRNIGLKDRNHCEIAAGNSRLDTMQAAILLVKLKYLDQWIAARRAHASAYRKAFTGLAILPEEEGVNFCTYAQFVLRHKKRDHVIKKMAEKGVDVKAHYPLAIHQQTPYQSFHCHLPVTEETVSTIFSLPCSHTLSPEDRGIVIQLLTSILEEI